MISAIGSNQPSFTSVVPVKIYHNGIEQTNPDIIRLGFSQLAKTLAGPVKKKSNSTAVAKKFSNYDPDYSILWALDGYPPLYPGEKFKACDYFRMVDDIMKTGQMFLLTGPHANKLKELGRIIGACKENKIDTPLKEAQIEYKKYLKKTLNDKRVRLRERFDIITRERQGYPVELHVYLKQAENCPKIYVDTIEFSRINNNIFI